MKNRVEIPEHEYGTPSIELGVPGRNGEAGMLLRAPASEELEWDLEAEVASSRRRFLEDREAWWIAAPYHQTVVSIVLRSFPSVLILGPDEDRLLSRDGHQALQERLF